MGGEGAEGGGGGSFRLVFSFYIQITEPVKIYSGSELRVLSVLAILSSKRPSYFLIGCDLIGYFN